MIFLESIGACTRRLALPLAACTAALLLSGCLTYSSAQISAMQTVDICETIDVQAYNLTPETRSAVQSELQRRNENCSKYGAIVAERRQESLAYEMYGKQSP